MNEIIALNDNKYTNDIKYNLDKLDKIDIGVLLANIDNIDTINSNDNNDNIDSTYNNAIIEL